MKLRLWLRELVHGVHAYATWRREHPVEYTLMCAGCKESGVVMRLQKPRFVRELSASVYKVLKRYDRFRREHPIEYARAREDRESDNGMFS
jgi:hypothetical protein